MTFSAGLARLTKRTRPARGQQFWGDDFGARIRHLPTIRRGHRRRRERPHRRLRPGPVGYYVTLYEADDRLGGHADTHEVTGPDGRVHGVDFVFIVYNERTYPLLTRLLAELDVPGQDSEMGMSVRCEGCGLQNAAHRGPRGLLPGLTVGRARYTKLLTEVPAFHLRAGNCSTRVARTTT